MAQRVLFILICLVCCFCPEVHSQSSASIKSENTPKERVLRSVENDGTPTSVAYKGQIYEVKTGKRGGHYITIGQDSTGKEIRRYVNQAKPTLVDLGNGTASYQGKTWPIQTGKRGGRYILTPNDRGGTTKRYLPKQK